MKPTILIFSVILCIGTTNAYAIFCEPYEACDPAKSYAEIIGSCPWGSTEHYSCYRRDDEPSASLKIFDCICPSGYTKIISQVSQCSNSLEYVSGCRCSCNNCASDTNWSTGNTGYQRRLKRWCDCTSGTATCKNQYEYQCAAGYYGTSSNGTSGCTQCPTWSGVYTNSAKTTLARGTSTAGTTAITGCYVAAGTYYDVTGTFKISSNCQYK